MEVAEIKPHLDGAALSAPGGLSSWDSRLHRQSGARLPRGGGSRPGPAPECRALRVRTVDRTAHSRPGTWLLAEDTVEGSLSGGTVATDIKELPWAPRLIRYLCIHCPF